MELAYIAKQLSLTFAVGLCAFIIGKGAFRKSLSLRPIEEIAILTAAGLGIIVLLLFALGTLRLFTPASVFCGIGVLMLLAIWRLKLELEPFGFQTIRHRIKPKGVVLLTATLILLTPVVLVPLTPPIHSDELRYHLPYALHFVEQRAITPDLYLRYPFFTLNINLLYSFALMIGDDVTTHYMHFLLGALAALNLYSLALRLSNVTTALSATLLYLTLPIFSQLSASAYIDLGLTSFTFAAIANIFHHRNRDELAPLLCSGLLFGIALGSKYLALAYIPLLLGWAFYHLRSCRPTLLFMLTALIVALPWYVYNAIHTGNPFSPFAGEYFGYWPWRPEDMEGQVRHLSKQGHGHSMYDLLMLPYNLMVNHWHFSSPQIPAILIAVFPCFIFIPWMEKQIRPFSILLLAAFTIWFFSAQVLRYLATFTPLWCFLSVWFLTGVIAFSSRAIMTGRLGFDKPTRMIPIPPILVLLLVLFHYRENHLLVYPSQGVQLVSGRDSFLEGRLQEYGLIKYLRNSDIEGKTIYQIGKGQILCYIRNNRVIGDNFGILSYGYLKSKHGSDVNGLIQELADEKVSYIAVRHERLTRPGWKALGDHMRRELTIEYKDDYVILFAIRNPAETHSRSAS